MQLHNLKPKHKLKRRKRVGRGGKRGTYSGKGIKGQMSRAGRKLQPIIREIIKKYPKLRGYKFRSVTKRRKPEVVVLNLSILDEKFKSGEKVTRETLLEKKLISKIRGKVPGVKILAKGELTKKLTIDDCRVSKRAKERVEKVGGKIL